MTCQLLISSATFFVIHFLPAEMYIEVMQEGFNIKCSFQDFVTVDRMCIDLMHIDEFCN
jgi:hypothetical protein